MAALDLFGRRWALRVLWELHCGPRTFRALRESCDEVSPTVLNTRLGELRDAGLVDAGDSGYALTELGRSLCLALEPLQKWSERWAREGSGSAVTRREPKRR
jgi:DNA-binding HxlR family transcriptional regulator